MSDLFLDLRDKVAVADFIMENLVYVSSGDHGKAEGMVKDMHDGKKVHTDKLAEVARKIAIESLPARYALKYFFQNEGIKEEWERVVKTVRPSTAHLLKRFREAGKLESLDQVLKHAESDVALHDDERIEINEVRKHLREDYWKEHAKNLTQLVKDGQAHLVGYEHRLGKLRDLAIVLPRNLQDEVFSKLTHYEDRIYFEGELVPLEILDEEIKYYVDQKEISPME
ncbi:MAG: hypothetical protein ABIB04_04490 [Patescibacteria group bacterium]